VREEVSVALQIDRIALLLLRASHTSKNRDAFYSISLCAS
jgi:hypothetical protein